MYLSPSQYNRPDDMVRETQRMLNLIRARYHHLWEHLDEDGIYGPASARAVKKFQEYRNISSIMASEGPILGDTTLEYIRQIYFTQQQLSCALPLISPDSVMTCSGIRRIGGIGATADQYKIPERKFGVAEFSDMIMGMIKNFDDFLNQEIKYVASVNPYSKNALKRRVTDFVTRNDSNMRSIRYHMDSLAAGDVSRGLHHEKRVQVKKINFVEELKKIDIVGKIEKKVASMGFVKTISVKAPGPVSKINIRGGGVLALWNYRNLIADALNFREWGEDAWRERVRHHFFVLIDTLVLGMVCTWIAEAVVALLVAAGVLLTVSSGVIIILVAVVSVLLATLFSYIFNLENNSFSEKVVNDLMLMISGIQL